MTDSNIEVALEKARAFFERAEQVAATDNFDYAIDMFLEGIRRAPDALEDGHAALRKMALIREAKGGKKPSVVDKLKRRGGKDHLEEMINAEYLLAKDPDNVGYAEAVMKAASAGGFKRTAEWMADLVFSALKSQDNPSVAQLLAVRDCYEKLDNYEKAVAACVLASKLRPDDGVLTDAVKNLSAQAAMKRGKYDQQGDFRKSIKDIDKQKMLHDQEQSIKSEDYRQKAVQEAKEKLAKAPDSFTNRIRLADALVDLGQEDALKQAENLLNEAYEKTGEFGYKKHLSEIEIKLARKQLAKAKAEYEKTPSDENLKKKFGEIAKKLANIELEHYKLCVDNYPTDLRLKYEYGLRLLLNKEFDKAIPLFQDARRDPRLKVYAMDKAGICFFNKGWFEDAIDIFKETIGSYEIADDSLGKELRYNLARAYEQNENSKDALDMYRKIAQMDYGFKDVSERVNSLRQKLGQ